MTKADFKHAMVSILVGAATAAAMALIQGLLAFMQAHAVDMISGAATTVTYLARARRIS